MDGSSKKHFPGFVPFAAMGGYSEDLELNCSNALHLSRLETLIQLTLAYKKPIFCNQTTQFLIKGIDFEEEADDFLIIICFL